MACKTLMVQGTGSGVGKSTVVAGLCRVFRDMGVRVAPFKAQNIALNSSITIDGGEIARAQALQALASGIEPSVDMNPVLIKPSDKNTAQVIVHGKVCADVRAGTYHRLKKTLASDIKESFDRLCMQYDLIVLEGAGSAAEINLAKDEQVNMFMARYAGAPVLLVADIDRGGVFASFYGTVKLLGRDSRYIKGLIINGFRGNMDMFGPGLDMIRGKTGKPVVGVIPYINDIGLPEEDGWLMSRQGNAAGDRGNNAGTSRQRRDVPVVTIVVVKLQYISNFTDFDPLSCEQDVDLVFSGSPAVIRQADMVIVPGSKNTMDDLSFLRSTGMEHAIRDAHAKGTEIIGICGGYQMLGKRLCNPYKTEGAIKRANGIGLLDIETTFQRHKITCQVEAELVGGNGWLKAGRLKGLHAYEIHMGESRGDIGLFRINRLTADTEGRVKIQQTLMDGSMNGNCWGTYMHGIFENDRFRRYLLDRVRDKKGLGPLHRRSSYARAREGAIDRLAKVIRVSLDMDFIKRTVGL